MHSLSGFAKSRYKWCHMSNASHVIVVLNGASSSGKTLTARALVKLLNSNCILTGLDDILERDKPFDVKGTGALASIRRAIKIMLFQLTDGRLKLFKKLHHEVLGAYRSGQSVIVETSLMDQRALRDAALCFSPFHALFVGMKPPLEVSEGWEAKRNDRPIGQARKHYDLIHSLAIYDLTLDSSLMSPEECAASILNYLNESRFGSFQKILESIPE